MRALVLQIDGMSCGHCLNAVNGALGALDGVEVDSVRIGRAELRFDDAVIDADRIASAVTAEGYPARVEQQG